MRSIRFEKVAKKYPGASAPAVVDCSLVIEEGKLVVLMGPSGSGKTTLLKMVNRLIEPDEGQIFVDSTEVHQLEATALRRQIGYVIQQIGLFPHLTVAQNIAVVPELSGWARDRIRSRIDELLEMVGLPPSEYRSRFPSQLSGGQQQRVGLARALAADPDVLLMDEPFGALDGLTRRDLQAHLLRLQQRLHKTILFVTHDVEEALLLADRVAVMRAGSIIQEGTPLDLLTRPCDQFVSTLIGSGDVMRRLSLVAVAALMQPGEENCDYPAAGLAAIPAHEDLRNALSLMLRAGTQALAVSQNGKVMGIITLEMIREVARAKGQADGVSGQ